MQIFVTSSDPYECAKRLWANPNRARKMITETQQILACCQQHFFGEVTILKTNGEPFKTPKSRMNHPCVKWACESVVHFEWLSVLLAGLYSEYDGDKFTNVHDNIDILAGQIVEHMPIYFLGSVYQFLNFAKADSKGLDFTDEPCVFTAYDKFLKAQGA